MKTYKLTIPAILLVMVFVIATFLPDATALAQDTRGVVAPTTLSPHGTILDTTPTYKWSKVTGATIYRYQVWKGSSLVMDKSPDSGVCGATTCEKSPAVTLGTNVYKWRVKAYKAGVWSAWSAYMNFTVSPAGFNDQFNGAMGGWARKSGGTWALSSGMYLYTIGLANKWSTAMKTGKQYSDFDYSARFWRYGPDVQYLVFRMGTYVATDGGWYPGYEVGYHNAGYYSIWRMNSATNETEIQPWTYSAAIVQDGWNTLRVVAKGDNFWFYINGTLVKTFSDSTYSRGYVGVAMYSTVASAAKSFYVDWAKLTPIATAQ